MDKKRKVLLIITLIVICYVGVVFLFDSPLIITKEKIIKENFEKIDLSEALLISGNLNINLMNESFSDQYISYKFDFKHNLNKKDLKIDFYPALKDLDTNVKIVMDDSSVKVFYSILNDKEILAYEQLLKEDPLDTKGFIKELINEVIKNKSGNQVAYSKDIIKTIEKGKQVKTYGYSFEKSLDKTALKSGINEMLKSGSFDEINIESKEQYLEIVDLLDLKTVVLLNRNLEIRKIELVGFYDGNRIIDASLMIDFKNHSINTE